MKYIKLLLIVLVIAVFGVALVSAQNDPSSNPDANACLAGGSMEGKCNQDSNGDGVVSQAEIDWAWTCGWYLIRWEEGLISAAQMPSSCQSLTQYGGVAYCFGDQSGWGGSWLYDGTPGVDENFIWYSGGNCHGDFNTSYGNNTILVASSAQSAAEQCEALYGPDWILVALIDGDDLWWCWGPFD